MNQADVPPADLGTIRSAFEGHRAQGFHADPRSVESIEMLMELVEWHEARYTALEAQPRYALIPETGHIIRRCQRCSAPCEVPSKLSQVGITNCRACVAEDRVAEQLVLLANQDVAWKAVHEINGRLKGTLRECRDRLAKL